jgi:pilus assembly protein FimV
VHDVILDTVYVRPAGLIVNKPLKSVILKKSVMTVLMALAFGAQGAGLGKLSVYSGIGQPLNAEVAVIATPAELSSITAKLASHEAFREAGIEYMSQLSDVRFEVGKNAAGDSVLKLKSSRPIDEPFLHFLIELSWTAGRVVREYTFLLDPPDMLRAARPVSVVSPTPRKEEVVPRPESPKQVLKQRVDEHLYGPTGSDAQAEPQSPRASAPKATTAAASVQAAVYSPSDEYLVKKGDTLSRIAQENRVESVTLDQMLVALFNANADAFVANNMNRLRTGAILRVPNATEVASLSPSEARKIVIGHVTEFNAYRDRLAGVVAESPPTVAAPPRQEAVGAIKPRVEAKTPEPIVNDKLEVSRTEASKSKVVGGLEDDLIVREKALREAAARIGMLEKNIENLKNLVEIKSQTGAHVQAAQETSQSVQTPVVPPALPAEPAKPATPSEQVVSPPKPAVVPALPVAPPLPEPSFVDENPELVFGGAGLLTLLLGYLGYSSWRRRKAQAASEHDDFADGYESDQIEPQASGTRAMAHDSDELSIQGDFTDNGLLTSEAVVDPVAEADVLMAYGRDAQAEEVLQDGLSRDPLRSAIHLKLLDLYAKQGNVAKFEAVAGKLHQISQGRGPEWDRALGLAGILGLAGGIFGAGEALAQRSEFSQTSVGIDSTQVPVSVEVSSPVPSASELELDPLSSLDFDLDLGTPVKEDAPAESLTTTADDLSLDFDFDLGDEDVKAVADAIRSDAEAPDDIKLEEMDFDLDLGSPVEQAVEEMKVSAGEEKDLTQTEIVNLNDLKLDFDLDLDDVPDTSKAEPIPPVVRDIPVKEDGPLLPATPIEKPTLLVEPTPEPAPISVESDEPENPEVATKLELAQAYEEMGDLDGARELLNEVLSEGSKAQQAQAQAKLDQMNV